MKGMRPNERSIPENVSHETQETETNPYITFQTGHI
jgi:hypothetical protein